MTLCERLRDLLAPRKKRSTYQKVPWGHGDLSLLNRHLDRIRAGTDPDH